MGTRDVRTMHGTNAERGSKINHRKAMNKSPLAHVMLAPREDRVFTGNCENIPCQVFKKAQV